MSNVYKCLTAGMDNFIHGYKIVSGGVYIQVSHLDEVAMGSEERQELEAKIDELEDRVSDSYTTQCACKNTSWQVK